MKSILPFFLIPIVLLSSCSEAVEHPIQKHYETFTVKNGSLTIEDSIIASVEGENTSELAFKAGGRIQSIFVRPGESVKQGQILAELSNQEGEIQASGLDRILADLDTTRFTTEAMKLSTTQMQKSIGKTYDERIKQAEIGVKNLEIELQKAENSLSNQTDSLDANYHVHLSGFLKLADSMLYEADKSLGMTVNFEYANDGWENYLGSHQGDSKKLAEDAWNALYTLRGEMRTKTNIAITSANAKTEYDRLARAYAATENLGTAQSTMLENTVVGAGLSEEMLRGWITIWNGLKASEQLNHSNFTIWNTQAKDLTVSGSGATNSVASMSLLTLRGQLESAKKNIDALKAERESKIQEVRISVIEIEGKKNELDAKISETSLSRALAGESIEYSIIRAPFAGVVLEKFANVGNVVNTGMPMFRLSSGGKRILKTYIDNSKYNFQVGSIITVQSTTTNATFSGTISLIQKEKDPLHNKNYTEITIEKFTGTLGERMNISLSREKTPLENGTIIPLESIITRYGPTGVFLLENGVAHFTLVEILASDTNYAEVIGIPEGSEIITKGKENIIDGEILPIVKK